MAAYPWDASSLQAVQAIVAAEQLPMRIEPVDFGSKHSAQGSDGYLHAVNEAVPDWIIEAGIPAVRQSGHGITTIPEVTWDDVSIGKLAARHFIEKGYRTVANIRAWNNPSRRSRLGAFVTAAEESGLEVLHYRTQANRRNEGDAHLLRWLRDAPAPLGVFLHHDRDAIVLLDWCWANGLHVPDDVAILGVEDIPMVSKTDPPLSTVVMPRAAIAVCMLRLLHRQLSGDTVAQRTVINPVQVASRASTTLRRVADPVIDDIRERMSRMPHYRHDVVAHARRHDLSRSQLHRRFVAACGMSPTRWLRICRLSRARELLSDTDLDHSEIAVRCGISTLTGLWKLFTDAGLPPPSLWRARVRGAEPP